MIQVGARNMQNYTLLSEVGRSGCAGAAQARPVGDARGAADGGRVHPQGGQRAGDALRAGHPDLRDRLPLHARPDGDPGAQGALATCRSSSTRATLPAGATSSCRCRWPRPPPAPTASSSRSTPTPTQAICDGPQALRVDDFAEFAAQVERAAALAGKAFTHADLRRRVRVAVIGVGLIGGSIGLAARRAPGRDGGGFDPDRGGARGGARARGDRPRRRTAARGGGRRRAGLRRGAGRRLAGCDRRGPRTRRRPTARSPTSARPNARIVAGGARPALRRRPPAGRRRDRRASSTRGPTSSTGRSGT